MATGFTETLAAESLETEIGGRKLKCSPISGADRVALRAFIRRQRIEAIKETCRNYSADVFAKALAEVAAQPVSDAELFSAFTTDDGMSFLIWRGVHRNHPDVTHEWIEKSCPTSELLLIAQRLYLASGYASDASGDDRHLAVVAKDYDMEVATVVRYYHLSLAEAEGLSVRQVNRLMELIQAVALRLGEAVRA